MTGGTGNRLAAFRRRLRETGVEGFLVTDALSIRYLAGVRDAAWALVTPRLALVMPFALGYEAALKAAGRPWRVLPPGGRGFVTSIARAGVRRVGFDANAVSHAEHARLRRTLKDFAVLAPLTGVVEACREIKDEREVESIARAGSISSAAGAQFPWTLHEGITESDAAALLDIRMRTLGAEGPAFETIVLFGERSALPHGVPGPRRLRPGDLVLADFGARVDGYASDITRVWVWRKATRRQEREYRAVARAYTAGRSRVRPGVPAGAADAAARRALGRLGGRFIHGLGHGVGLEIHERPRLGKGERGKLRSGMVVTVEPGVYRRGWGGIRLEDTFVVNARGALSLTGAPPPELPIVGQL